MADIELVIKIDEEIYTHFVQRYKYQDINDIGLSESDKVGVAIKNGIPLPKGHGRLIDADYLRCKIAFVERSNISMIVDQSPIIIEADKENKRR